MAGLPTALSGIVLGLQTLASGLISLAAFSFSIIPFVGPSLSGVVGAVGNLAIGFVSGFTAGFTSSFSASPILTSVINTFVVPVSQFFAVGSQFTTVEGTLRAIGLSPKVAHYISVGFDVAIAIATANPATIASTLTSFAVQEIGPRIGLSPTLTNALSIATSALSGTIAQGAFDPTTTVFKALKDAAPRLAANFAQAGIIGLGDAVGLDPRISALISLPTGLVVQGLTTGLVNPNGGGGPGQGIVVGTRDDGTQITVTGAKGLFDYVNNTK